MTIAGRDMSQGVKSLDALDLAESRGRARTCVVPKKKTPTSRIERVLHVHLIELIRNGKDESVKSVADKMGISQGHLNDQVTGKKPTTLDALDQVAAFRNKTATQVLIRLRDIAADLDRDEPGWDSRPFVPVVVADAATQKERIEDAAEAAKEISAGENVAPRAKPKRARIPRRR